MSQEICSSLDLIEELRLRRWARENYVPLQARSESLHPIVRAHFSTGVFLDGEVVYMLMDEGAA